MLRLLVKRNFDIIKMHGATIKLKTPQLHPTDNLAPPLHSQIFSINLKTIPFKRRFYYVCFISRCC